MLRFGGLQHESTITVASFYNRGVKPHSANSTFNDSLMIGAHSSSQQLTMQKVRLICTISSFQVLFQTILTRYPLISLSLLRDVKARISFVFSAQEVVSDYSCIIHTPSFILKHSVDSGGKEKAFSFNSQEKIKGEMLFYFQLLILCFCTGS